LVGRTDLLLLQAGAEDRASTNTGLRGCVLADDHVVAAGHLGAAGIIHPARLKELELIFDRGLDGEKEQSAIAVLRIAALAIVIFEGLTKGHPDSQQSL